MYVHYVGSYLNRALQVGVVQEILNSNQDILDCKGEIMPPLCAKYGWAQYSTWVRIWVEQNDLT